MLKSITTPSLFLALLALLVVVPASAKPPAEEKKTEVVQPKPQSLPIDELRAFAEIFGRIKNDYVEDIGGRKLIEQAIRGMVSGLDPHSSYLNNDEYQDLQEGTSGEFSGLGLGVGMEDGYVKIIAPIDGSPAAEAGLQSGDIILKLGKAPVKGMSLNEAIDMMRGPKGSEITLHVDGEDEQESVDKLEELINNRFNEDE